MKRPYPEGMDGHISPTYDFGSENFLDLTMVKE
jgi:hypothetical protein